MPIYEFESVDPSGCCPTCAGRFEVIRPAGAEPLVSCPDCGSTVRRVVSRCRAHFATADAAGAAAGKTISDYERQGMWSHAAELAEKQAAKSKDGSLRERAFDNYHKAGYNASSLERHARKVDQKATSQG